MTDSTHQHSFYGLGLAPQLRETLADNGFVSPTPIQRQAIPLALEGKDIIGLAQTGTGKTLAFVLPMLQHLVQRKGKGLVLVPTRELAMQCEKMLAVFSHKLAMRSSVIIGGTSAYRQIQSLKQKPRIIIATPGRLIDLLQQRKVYLGDVHTVVLDEADRMLDMGFEPQIRRVLSEVPKDRHTMLFSATISRGILKIATRHMHMPVEVEVVPSGTTAEGITQELFIVKKENKMRLLEKLLKQYHGSVLMFSRTKRGAGRIRKAVKAMGFSVAEIHSDISMNARTRAMEGFKTGKHRVLVATDIASRGIDVAGIEMVINYDLPDDAENYVHRIGRTARAGLGGHAVSFATPDQKNEMRRIETFINAEIPVSMHPDIPAEKFTHTSSRPQKRGGYFAPRSSSGRRRRRVF